MERGPAGFQQDLEGAVREGLPEVPRPPRSQLQTERYEGPAVEKSS